MNLPFTQDQFFEIFAAYNRSLWPFAFVLWLYALVGAAVLARFPNGAGRFVAAMLTIQWGWTAVAYHLAFFSSINPAAWLFAAMFLLESAQFAWFGVVRGQLHFSPGGSARHALAWTLIIYSLIYTLLVRAGGHLFPAAPTFGVPCPTTLLTIGFLFAMDRPWPLTIAVIPILWALVAGSAAGLLDVRADFMLWAAGLSLMGYLSFPTIRSFIRRQPVAAYFTLTFIISWGGALLAIGSGGAMGGTTPASDPRFAYALMAMLAGPSVTGILLTWLLSGRAALRAFQTRLCRWRTGAAWYAVALLTAPIAMTVTLLTLSAISPSFLPGIFTSDQKTSLLLVGIAVGVSAGVFEELG